MVDFQNDFVKHLKPYVPVSYKVWSLVNSSNGEIYKLDWNEATIPPSPKVFEYIFEYLKSGKLNWYPPVDNPLLREKIAHYVGVNSSNIQYFNGSDAALEIITKAFINPFDKVCIITPTYDNFRTIVESQGGIVIPFLLKEELGFQIEFEKFVDFIKKEQPKMVYICNPNNPTGNLYSANMLQDLICRFPNILFVIDEAYYEFSNVTVKNIVLKNENVIITRTFSKAFALASFRIGYTIAHENIIKILNKIRNPKNVSYIAQIAALASLEDITYMKKYVEEVIKAKLYFVKKLKDLKIGKIYGESGNFILVKLNEELFPKGKLLKFLEERKVFVRDLEHILRSKNFIRFTIGTYTQMQKIAKYLEEFLNK